MTRTPWLAFALLLACGEPAPAPSTEASSGAEVEAAPEPDADEEAEPAPEASPPPRAPDVTASARTSAEAAPTATPRGPTVGLASCDPTGGALWMGSPVSLGPVLDAATDCYRRELEETPDVEGTVAVSFTVTVEGATTGARVLPRQPIAAPLSRCTTGALEAGRVEEPPSAEAQVVCRFVYRP